MRNKPEVVNWQTGEQTNTWMNSGWYKMKGTSNETIKTEAWFLHQWNAEFGWKRRNYLQVLIRCRLI